MFFSKKSVQEVIAKMAAVDGIPFHVIENSEFIRKSLATQGLKLTYHQGFSELKRSLKLKLPLLNERRTEKSFVCRWMSTRQFQIKGILTLMFMEKMQVYGILVKSEFIMR